MFLLGSFPLRRSNNGESDFHRNMLIGVAENRDAEGAVGIVEHKSSSEWRRPPNSKLANLWFCSIKTKVKRVLVKNK